MLPIRTLVAHQHKASGWTKLEQRTILPRYAEVIIAVVVKVIFISNCCLSLWSVKKYNHKALMGSKTGWTATGCTGTATWKIGDSGKMLAIMWSIPFDQNWYQSFENQNLTTVTHLLSLSTRIDNPNS